MTYVYQVLDVRGNVLNAAFDVPSRQRLVTRDELWSTVESRLKRAGCTILPDTKRDNELVVMSKHDTFIVRLIDL